MKWYVCDEYLSSGTGPASVVWSIKSGIVVMKWNLKFLLLTVQGQNDEGNKKRVFTTQGKL